MTDRRPRKTKEQWTTVIADYEASSLPVEQYCQRHNLATVTLHKWRRRLSAPQAQSPKPSFTELKPQPSKPESAHDVIRVVVGSAITLTIRHGH